MESCLENCLEPGARGKEAPVSAGAAAVPGVPGHPRGDRRSCDAWKPSAGKALESLIALQAVTALKYERITQKK